MSESHKPRKGRFSFPLSFKIPAPNASRRVLGYSPFQVLFPFICISLGLLITFGPTAPESSVKVATNEVVPQALPANPPEKIIPPKVATPEGGRKSRDLENFESYLSELKNQNFIFLYSKADEKIKISTTKISPLSKSLDAWKKWFSHYKLPFNSCEWRDLHRCQALDRRIFIVMPGRWDLQALEKMLNHSERIILFGMPYQIYDGKNLKSITFRNLTFEKSTHRTSPKMLIKGTPLLALGMSAGTKITAPPVHSSYRVLSTNFRVADRPSLVRYDVIKNVRSRGVWLDFLPEVRGPAEMIQMNMFRYLLGKNKAVSLRIDELGDLELNEVDDQRIPASEYIEGPSNE